MTNAPAKQPKRQPKPARGTLAIIGSLLLLSAILRMATEAGQVIASEALRPSELEGEPMSESPDLARPERLKAAFKAVQRREARVAERESELDQREKEIETAEISIREELGKLEQAEKSLRRTINAASEAAENDVAQLTDVYAKMKPKQAAALFEQMEASFAAGFLARMPPENAARIMAGLTPERAYLVSVELAGRNADIPLE
ncbi:hypothetical protein [Marivita sp. GX14005]|uniref:MotE family protein n=1 Tax=Marivita sp. GX14005 TaxID=2942276 RepID=UPI002019F2A9|nr:hypothetical protein [Marivita sp. GX14005]MCL3881833.1 hypothetical protein [Marivita sp. GX14005]